MKTLYLVRHAKSSWKDVNLPDHERPLNKRGEQDAPKMGKRLKRRRPKPEVIVTSPAVRAKRTAKILATEIGYPKSDILVDELIYTADQEELVSVLRRLDNGIDCVMLVGHNPALTDLVNSLAQCEVANVPTCGLAVLGFRMDSWADIDHIRAKLLDFDYPKKEVD
jgi:phosphohistidine phosphatase